MKNLDAVLGKFVLRLCAVVAFMAALASFGFGVVVVSTAPIPGILLFLLGIFFFWLGLRAWRDHATLGEILNREYAPVAKGKSPGKEP